jgi:TRAP transporter TAXI family solute receptor
MRTLSFFVWTPFDGSFGRNAWRALSVGASATVLFCCLAAFAPGPAHAYDKFIALGTAYRAGTYFPVGEALCRRINRYRDETKIRCLSYETGGSVYNIQALTAGELDLAITQSNLLYNAYHGLGEFAKFGPNKSLRTVVNLYDQPLTVTVHKDSGIANFSELPGKILNIGNEGSGKRALAEKIMSIMGWQRRDFSSVLELSTGKQARAFCERKIDIMVETVGIPTPLYKTVEKCGGVFLDLPEKLSSGFKALGPFFFDYRIPRSINANTTHDVKTIGLKIVLISRSSVSNETIRSVAASLMGERGAFQKLHEALSLTSERSMTEQSVHVPLHGGVAEFLSRRQNADGGRS